MSDVPARCPTCSTAIPAGALKCPGCGRVFGEDNRCPSCNAIASVRQSGGGYVCVACGKPRELLPGTVILGGGGRPSSVSIVPGALDPATAARTRGLRLLGAMAVGGGVGVAVLATMVLGTGALGIAAALLGGAAGIALGIAAMRRAARLGDDVQRKLVEARGKRVLALAEKSGGDLVARDVARELSITEADADAALTSLADGERATVEVDTQSGDVHYVFPALRRSSAKVRVELADEAEADAAALEELERKRTRI